MTRLLLDRSKNVKYGEEVYIYGCELIISTVLCFTGVMLTSLLFSELPSGIVFIIVFSSLRAYAGGYHADTYGRCFMITNSVYLGVLMLKEFFWEEIPLIVYYVTFFVSIYYIASNAPMINENQPIDENKQNNCKRNIKCVLFVDVLLIVLLTFINKELMCMTVFTICLVMIFMMISHKKIMINERGAKA